MPYTVIIITPDGITANVVMPKAPNYEYIKATVGGFIQQVPHLTKLGTHKRGQMFVNEEGMIHSLPFNSVATKYWLENLGDGPFSYEPRLYGTAIYWAKVPKVK